MFGNLLFKTSIISFVSSTDKVVCVINAIFLSRLLSSDFSISGDLDNIRFEMDPTIYNPRFDKIKGDKQIGISIIISKKGIYGNRCDENTIR